MSFYQSALDIAAESRDAPDSIPARTSAILSALDGLGRRLSATRFLDKDFSLAQAEAQAKQTNRSAPLFGVPMAHKELYGRAALIRPGTRRGNPAIKFFVCHWNAQKRC